MSAINDHDNVNVNIDDDLDDPFSCFDSDDDDGDDENDDNDATDNSNNDNLTTNNNGNQKQQQLRNSDCGILSFHAGTERALLMYVEKRLLRMEEEEKMKKTSNNNNSSLSQIVLDAIDEYCFTRHWMMHIGQSKGTIIKEFLQKCCSSFKQNKTAATTTTVFNVLEIGTYCGYSSILIATILIDIFGTTSKNKFKFYTIEVVEENINIARKMIEYSKLDDVIEVLHYNPYKESLSSFLKREIITSRTFGPTSTTDDDDDTGKQQQQRCHVIDFLFIDHDKDLYLDDLQELESSGWIQEGCHVAADNVVFAKIDNYRNYVSKLQQQGIVKTQLKDTYLEYSINNDDTIVDNNNDVDDGKNNNKLSSSSSKEILRDGIGLTVYLKDPPPPVR